eukprot:352239-Chlamydomonas_euryale.AAC.10
MNGAKELKIIKHVVKSLFTRTWRSCVAEIQRESKSPRDISYIPSISMYHTWGMYHIWGMYVTLLCSSLRCCHNTVEVGVSQIYRKRTHKGYTCVECSKAEGIKQRAGH